MGSVQVLAATNFLPASSLPGIVVGLAIFVLILLVFVIIQGGQVRKMKKAWGDLLTGTNGESLERLLQDHLRHNAQWDGVVGGIEDRVESLERQMVQSKRFIGLVRYDAFNDVGGSQSFSLAVYDDEGNGAVVTSQVGRSDCRVFGKMLHGGKADVNLTVEEQKAIDLAAQPKGRPRISP
ncbi:MAG: DUF4446 family protein [Armatimonadetes bacterium]|nr:DUF4446 family protein [Armatimonadota bacterium]